MNSDGNGSEGSEVAVIALVMGLVIPVFFSVLTQGGDFGVFAIVLVSFAACISYCEIYLSLPSGEALGIGMLVTPVLAQNLWLVALAAAASVLSLSKYALRDSRAEELDADLEEISPLEFP